MKNSDVFFSGDIVIAASGYYSKRYKGQARRMAEITKKALPIFRKHLDLPPDVLVRICPIKSRSKQGQYVSESKMVEIEFRNRRDFNFLSTLAHELIHAEQYHTGRLSYSYSKRLHQWDGKDVNNKGTTYYRYINQPWERQAFDCQDAFAVIVCNELNIDHRFK